MKDGDRKLKFATILDGNPKEGSRKVKITPAGKKDDFSSIILYRLKDWGRKYVCIYEARKEYVAVNKEG